MLRSRVTFCLLASYLLMRAGDAQTLPSLPTSAANWDEFKTALSAKTEEDQNRMWCQCSTDGITNGAETAIGFDARTGAAPYRFIGCGAHTNYYTKGCITPGWSIIEQNAQSEGTAPDPNSCCSDYNQPPGGGDENFATCARPNQFGGYPYRLCYPEGPCEGATGFISIDKRAAFKSCGGYMGCNADRQARWDGGALISTHVEEPLREDPASKEKGTGKLAKAVADWSSCCKRCSTTAGCVAWDFAPLSSSCNLYSTQGNRVRDMWFYAGVPGFDDAPLECQKRSDIHTCLHAPKCDVEDLEAAAAKNDPKICDNTQPVRCMRSDGTGMSRLQCTTLDSALDEACEVCREDDIREGLHPRDAMIVGVTIPGSILLIFAALFSWCRCDYNRKYVSVETDQVVGKGIKTQTRTRSTKHGVQTYQVTIYVVEVEYTWEGSKRVETISREGKNYTNKLSLSLIKETGRIRGGYCCAGNDGVFNIASSGEVSHTWMSACQPGKNPTAQKKPGNQENTGQTRLAVAARLCPKCDQKQPEESGQPLNFCNACGASLLALEVQNADLRRSATGDSSTAGSPGHSRV
uniref:Apple domain-containing protein n=1 Tax=Hemiselmis andersenii TaxID=464988 RepID=A0A6U4XB00_HEMAN|mmetsp:Transcript_34478/g.83881  ORF Transcript_34478/g.83881 Transcript_34478/m.83881 type:complete len:578 (+) Transcript_34478:130-1863(+)